MNNIEMRNTDRNETQRTIDNITLKLIDIKELVYTLEEKRDKVNDEKEKENITFVIDAYKEEMKLELYKLNSIKVALAKTLSASEDTVKKGR
jgi:hypothetical protein